MNLINVLPFHKATITGDKKTQIVKLEAEGQPTLELNATEALAIKMWLNNLRRHSLPTMLIVGDKSFTIANTTGMSASDYKDAIDSLVNFSVTQGPIELEAFYEDNETLLGNIEAPVYLRKREGVVDVVLGLAMFVPKAATKEEKAATDELTKVVFGAFGLPGLPVIVREIMTVTGEARAVSLLEGQREMNVTDMALTASHFIFKHIEEHFDNSKPRVAAKAQA